MEKKFIEIRKVSDLYDIDFDLIRELIDFGLIPVYEAAGTTQCFDVDDVDFLLCITRLKSDFELNNEAVEIIMNMRERMERMQKEVEELHRKLNRYEEYLQHRLFTLPDNKGLISEFDSEEH